MLVVDKKNKNQLYAVTWRLEGNAAPEVEYYRGRERAEARCAVLKSYADVLKARFYSSPYVRAIKVSK